MGFLQPHIWCSEEWTHCYYRLFSRLLEAVRPPLTGLAESMAKQLVMEPLQEFPLGLIRVQRVCDPRGPPSFLPWNMNGSFCAWQSTLEGFSVLSTCNRKPVEVWVSSSLRPPHCQTSWPFPRHLLGAQLSTGRDAWRTQWSGREGSQGWLWL